MSLALRGNNMAYFSTSQTQTPEAQLKSALQNIELWEELDTGGEYLISGFCKHQIEQALELLSAEKENKS